MNKAECLLKWHGSKRALAPAIVNLFPADYRDCLYVEPFCGSAAVFYVKQRSKTEVSNDINEDLVNFLVTVKWHAQELARCLRLIPNSRELFVRWIDAPEQPTSILRALRFLYLSKVSYGGLREHWAPDGRSGEKAKPCVLHSVRRRLWRWAERLAHATIECAPWQEIIEKYDCTKALFYIDPPYVGTSGYGVPFGMEYWRELRGRMASVKGRFVVSASGTAEMKLLWRGLHQRLTAITSSLGPNDRRQRELLVWNY